MAAAAVRRPTPSFTPERTTEEHRLIAQTAKQFVENEVLPVLDRLEQKDWTLSRQLVKRAADLGLLGVDVPDTYGGVGLDKVSSLIVSERMAPSASFGATWGAHGEPHRDPDLPVRQRGAEEEILPKLLSGEIVGAYALSETGSGSDALGAQHARHAAAGRQLRAERREDVDHQRRLRRSDGRLRAKSTASSSPHFLVERPFAA